MQKYQKKNVGKSFCARRRRLILYKPSTAILQHRLPIKIQTAAQHFENHYRAKMHHSLVCVFFGMAFFVLFYSMASAAVISCPPNSVQQEINPKINQLCFAIEQALQDSPQNDGYNSRLLEEQNTNLNAKRQDVDHVFLRFGRRYGL